MNLLALGLMALGALAVWHLRLPRPPRLDLSASPFLQQLPPPRRRRRQWMPVVPWRSGRMWLRLLIGALLLIALWDSRPRDTGEPIADALGVHIIVDVSDSMRVDAGDGKTRLDIAKAYARDILHLVAVSAGTAPSCTRLSGVAREIEHLGPASQPRIASLTERREGSNTRTLLSATRVQFAECPITHQFVLTDRVQGSILPDGPRDLRWTTLGPSRANAGLIRADVVFRSDTGRALRIDVALSGAMAIPTGSVVAPSGRSVSLGVHEKRSPTTIRYHVPIRQAGAYTIQLDNAGAYDGDDRAVVMVPPEPAPPDWRLDWPPSPFPRSVSGAGSDEPRMIVGPVDDISGDMLKRPMIGTTEGWGGTERISTFTQGSPLLRDVNFDALAIAAPVGLELLPDGFRPVMTGTSGRTWIAVRDTPPGAIVPPPVPGDDTVARVSQVVFSNAVAFVSEPRSRPLPLEWLSPDGLPIHRADLERDTGRPLTTGAALPVRLLPARVSTSAKGHARWPLFLLAALVLILVERLIGPAWRRGPA